VNDEAEREAVEDKDQVQVYARRLRRERLGSRGRRGQGRTCYGSRHPTDAPCASAWAHDHPRTFDPLYSYQNLLVTTPVTFFINTCHDRIARPADFTCRGALAYGNIPQTIFRYVSRSIIS
jgi:hypothetical protein